MYSEGSILTISDKDRLLIFAHQNRARFFRIPKSIYHVLICAHHKTEFVLFEYRNLETRSSRHSLSPEDELQFLTWGRGGGLLNGNPQVVFSQSHFLGTKILTTFALLFASIKSEFVLFGYRNLEIRSSRHQSSSMNFTFFKGMLLAPKVTFQVPKYRRLLFNLRPSQNRGCSFWVPKSRYQIEQTLVII